jgi:hypothetical protein
MLEQVNRHPRPHRYPIFVRDRCHGTCMNGECGSGSKKILVVVMNVGRFSIPAACALARAC